MASTPLVAARVPDLVSLLSLAFERARIADRNAYLPVWLPSLWAGLGETERAEAQARGIADDYSRVEALVYLAEKLLTDSGRAAALRLAAEVEPLIDGGNDSALAHLAALLAVAGDLAGTERVIAAIEDADDHPRSWRYVIHKLAASGDTAMAEDLTARLDDDWRARSLADLALAHAKAGNSEAATRLAAEAELLARAGGEREGADVLARLAEMLVVLGRGDEALRLAADAERALGDVLNDRSPDNNALVAAARAHAVTGRAADAERLISAIDRGYFKVVALENLVDKLVEYGYAADALRLAQEAESAAQEEFGPKKQAAGLAARCFGLAGDIAAAERILVAIDDARERPDELTAIGYRSFDRGEVREARYLAEQSEAASVEAADDEEWLRAIRAVTLALATAGFVAEAERLAARPRRAYQRALLLSEVALALANGRRAAQAARVAAAAHRLADAVDDDRLGTWVLEFLAEQLSAAGLTSEAEQVDEESKRLREGMYANECRRRSEFIEASRKVGAYRKYAQAEPNDEERRPPYVRNPFWSPLGEALHDDDLTAAEQEALAQGSNYAQADGLVQVAERHLAVGNAGEARRLAAAAEACGSYPVVDVARVYFSLGDIADGERVAESPDLHVLWDVGA